MTRSRCSPRCLGWSQWRPPLSPSSSSPSSPPTSSPAPPATRRRRARLACSEKVPRRFREGSPAPQARTACLLALGALALATRSAFLPYAAGAISIARAEIDGGGGGARGGHRNGFQARAQARAAAAAAAARPLPPHEAVFKAIGDAWANFTRGFAPPPPPARGRRQRGGMDGRGGRGDGWRGEGWRGEGSPAAVRGRSWGGEGGGEGGYAGEGLDGGGGLGSLQSGAFGGGGCGSAHEARAAGATAAA